MRAVNRVLLVLTWLVILPVSAFAQASITGVVQDASGAVLPGVTVEASSPVLIEKVRSAVTDGSGQYRIVDLRPGVYTVTFALTGFSTVKREGIELRGSFTASVNADLSVGSLAETITVSGESPVVDLQNTQAERALTKDVLDVIPAGRSHLTQAVLIPGLTSTQGAARGNLMDVGGTRNLQNTLVSIHGGRVEDTRVMIDGVRIGNMSGAGQWHNFVPDQGSTQEVVIDYGAVSAEQISGGLKINHVPREGGNNFKGSFYVTAVNESWQQNNITDDLRARGLSEPNRLRRMYDINPNMGGPIVRDKLWFYVSARFQENKNYIAGLYENKNAGDPTKWLYEPDPSRPVIFSLNQDSGNGRITWQVAPKHKVTGFYDQQRRPWDDNRAAVMPESSSWWRFPRLRTTQAGWTSPLTSRLLFEARVSNRGEAFQDVFEGTTPRRDLIGVLEQGGLIPGLLYRGHGPGAQAPFQWNNMPTLTTVLFNASYITGAHALKIGFTDSFGHQIAEVKDIPESLAYRFKDGIPNLITMRATPYSSDTQMRAELGLFIQDRWTVDRLTLTGGLRFDWLSYYYPENQIGPGGLVPNRNLTTPFTESVNWKDLTPRVGVAYDIFGDGKTAYKLSVGKYPINADAGGGGATAPGNPVLNLSNVATRSWDDRAGLGINGDYIPQCDLLNLQANGECGIASDLNFGGTRPARADDPATYQGWGSRAYNWEFSTGVQQQIVPRVAVEVAYFRRIYGNFTVLDNRATTAADYTLYSITAPLDPRLPGGGGYTVDGLYDLDPASGKVGKVDNISTFASNFGKWTEHWNGVDVTINARPRDGVVLQGGMSTGRTATDACEVRAKVPELIVQPPGFQFQTFSPNNPYCNVVTNFLTQVKLLGTYSIPRVDVLVGATFQSVPGPVIASQYIVSSAEAAKTLGRPLSGNAPSVTVNLIEPGTSYVPRANLLDLRLGKIFRFGQRRVNVNFDIHNALNRSAVLQQNDFLSSWQTPQTIMDGRLFKLSANIDF
jgi:Carboxypeptidase regulatory-like domain